MRILLSSCLLATVIAAAGCAAAGDARPTPTPAQPAPATSVATAAGALGVQSEASIAAWREDLGVLAERLPEVHPNLTWRVSEEAFQEAASNLEAQIPGLTDQQIVVELARIASLIDGHTHLPLFQANVDFQLYPLRLYQFSDGLFVVDAAAEYAGLVGSRVTGIGKADIDDAWAAVAPLAPRDNEMTVQLLTPVYLTVPEVLLALGIIEDEQRPGYVLEDAAGRTTVVDLPPIASDPYRNWTSLFIELAGLPARPEPLSLSRRDENFWYTFLEDSETLYIQYNQVQGRTASGLSLAGMTQQIASFLAKQPVRRLVVDIRHNPGGDINSARPLIEWLSESDGIDQAGRLYVIIGRHTFSAATLFAIALEQNTPALFVGEPTGGRPNLYGDVSPIRLPNSGISVLVSTIHWQTSAPDDSRDWIEPDIAAPLSSADFFAGRDPALETILGTAAGPDTS